MSRLSKVVVGFVSGDLTVIRTGLSRNGRSFVEAQCSCGITREVMQSNIAANKTTSCGCLKSAKCAEAARGNLNRLSHGMSRSAVYKRWDSMVQRCTNSRNPNYAGYGGKGLNVAAEWLSFEAFHRDMGDMPTPKHTLERMDNRYGYSKDNCVWATRDEQDNNKKQSIRYEYLGKLWSINELAELAKLPRTLIYLRLHRQGYSVEQSCFTPLGGKPKGKLPATKLKLYSGN